MIKVGQFEIDQTSIFNQLFNNEVVYVTNTEFKIVFVSKGALKFFQEINNTQDTPIDTLCYKSFRRRNTRCDKCRADSIFESDFLGNKIVEPDSEFPNRKIVYMPYIYNGKSYIIHHLVEQEMLDWMAEYSQKIIDNSKESIVVTDLNGKVISVNPTFKYKMGYGDEVIGNLNTLFYVNESDALTITNRIKEKGLIENERTKVKTKNNIVRDIKITAWIVNKGKDKVIVRVSKFLEKAQILNSVIKITENILKAYEPEKLTYHIVEETATLLESKFCSLYLVSPDGTKLILKDVNDSEYKARAKDIEYDLNWTAKKDEDFDGITSMVAVRGIRFEANSWDDVKNHPSHKGKLDRIVCSGSPEKNFKNMYAIPLVLDDKVKGVFRIENKFDGNRYDDIDKEIFDLMGKYIMLVLEEQNRLKKTLLAHIAHMTRAPIALAVMSLSLLENEDLVNKMSRSQLLETMRIVKNALLQANITVANLIIWSTDSKGKYVTSAGYIDMQEVVTKIIRQFEAYIKEIRFNVTMERQRILLSKPEQIKLEIILQNILHNSIKYAKHKKPIEDIDISGKIENDYYKIKIRDYGIGISKEDMKNIFTEFYKGESSKYIQGHGLGLGIGLASIKKICDETGWKYTLNSEKGHGTTFVLKIPLGVSEYG